MQKNKKLLFLMQIVFAFAVTTIVEAAPTLQTHVINPVGVIKGKAAGGLSLPSDVVIVDDQIYVVDGGNHRVAVFNNAGKFLFAFGSQGQAKNNFDGPVGIGADEKGNIYVADRGNHRIQVFDRHGKHKSSISTMLGEKPVRPIDVAVSPDGGAIYVTGNNSHSVMVFNRQGELLQNWGNSGSETGDFRYPATIIFTANKRVAVVDVFNTRVQIFEENGKFVSTIGDWGVLSGQLIRPKGIVEDKEGNFLISDSYMELVQVFDDSGHFLYVLGDDGKPRRMTSPAGMAIDDNGRLYVAEMLDNKVSIFELGR